LFFSLSLQKLRIQGKVVLTLNSNIYGKKMGVPRVWVRV
jgi:hypothetical protein